ncbi:MAG: DUF1445 domain-containing protein [Chloroflexi bacterium]|nr:DUF1445 domain-containing protein [Chloroflexota bacterium]
MTPSELRQLIRNGEWTGPTELAVCEEYAQANLAIIPKEYALDFLRFCHLNPQPCPLLEVTEPGDPRPRHVAADADLRTDLPKYRVYEDGRLIDEPSNIVDYWREDLVGFLLGCSGNFDWSLRAANLHYRIAGVFTTNVECASAGPFQGPVVVTCRLFKGGRDAIRAIQISSRFPSAHGAPIHVGDPSIIGIKDISRSDIGTLKLDSPPQQDEVAMFWACGLTVQTVAVQARLPIMITHYSRHMFVTDRLTVELSVI